MSTPLGMHLKITAAMGNPKPGSKIHANHNEQHHTHDNGTMWAMAIPRRGYFPQPGVVAQRLPQVAVPTAPLS